MLTPSVDLRCATHPSCAPLVGLGPARLYHVDPPGDTRRVRRIVLDLELRTASVAPRMHYPSGCRRFDLLASTDNAAPDHVGHKTRRYANLPTPAVSRTERL